MRLLPYGDRAVLVELDSATDVLPLAAACQPLDGVVEVIPAARTVLLLMAGPGSLRPVSEAVAGLRVDVPADIGDTGETPDEVVLDVVYDGSDLTSTAEHLGLDADGLVRAHTAASYVVGFCGFVPGFAYLTGLPDALHVPRLDSPRTRVPAGAVGLAGGFTGVYPRESPGGWRLLGRTDAVLFDAARTPPALLAPGTPVRFRPA